MRLPNPQAVQILKWFGSVITRIEQSHDDETPVVPLVELSMEPWSEERSDRLGGFRMFIDFAALMWVTVIVGVVITNRDEPTGAGGVDWRIARWMDQHRTERVTRLAESASLAGSAMVLIPAAMLAGVWIWRCAHRSGLAVLPPLALLDSEAIVQIANRIVDRARPLSGLAASTFGGSAWPSSNAASAMATAASVWVVTAALQRSMSIRRRVNGIAGFVAVLVALSPIVLGAHWTTDVLMGGVVGLTVVAVLTRPLLIGTMPMDDVSAIR